MPPMIVALAAVLSAGADIAAIKISATPDHFGDLSQGDYAAPGELRWDR